jgi:L-fuculose-phosphate aldolase
MGERKNYLIGQVVKYSQKLDEKGFGANHDGNISVRFEDVLLATPTAVSKGNVLHDLVITLDWEGNKIEGIGKPFSEIKLHLAAYRCREEARAVVHAHPPFSSAMGLVGKPLYPIYPEAIISIGEKIPVARFAMPGDAENDNIIAEALAEADVLMLPGNGVLAIGDSVEQAYLRLELVEHIAKMQFYAEQMGTSMTLSEFDKAKLLEKRRALGLGPTLEKNKNADFTELENLIAAEVKKAISDRS